MVTNNSANNISSTLIVQPSGTGTGQTGEVRLNELVANGTNFVSFKSPDSLAGDTPYTMPTTYPSVSGQILSATTAGVMSWATAASAGSFTKITETAVTVAVANVSFTGLTNTYRYYVLALRNVRTSANTEVRLLFSTNNGTSYLNGVYNAYRQEYTNTSYTIVNETNFISLGDYTTAFTGTIGLASNAVIAGIGATNNMIRTQVVATSLNSASLDIVSSVSTSTAVNAIRVVPTSGNLTDGIIVLYGVS